jgi:GMP synthase (glutamine-hydrolysing)
MRKDSETRIEEYDEFIRLSGIPKSNIRLLSVFDTPVFPKNILDSYDGLFVGGSSDDPEDTVDMPAGEYPYIESTESLIKYAYDSKTPTFASCMGFHIATWTLGGTIILDKANKEIGTYDITLTEAAKQDTLFTDIPDTFVAVSGHKKRATILPPGAIHLASSALCPYHAYTFADRPFYAFQFHPEIDKPDLVARLRRYIDRGYVADTAELEALIDSVKDAPHANKLLKQFVDYVL